MSHRLTIRVFKGLTEEDFRNWVAKVALDHGGKVWWDCKPEGKADYLKTSHNGAVHALCINHGGFLFCKKVGAALSVPWIELRVQEGILWDYSLKSGDKHLGAFSTLPEYWDDDEERIAANRGDPKILAKVLVKIPKIWS